MWLAPLPAPMSASIMDSHHFLLPSYSTNSPGWNTTCAVIISIFGHRVQAPLSVLACFLASLIGVHAFRRIRRLSDAVGYSTYQWSFLMFAFMMPSSALVTSILTPGANWHFIVVALFDAGLTSSIAFSFVVNGLVDTGVLKDGRKTTYAVLILGALGCFGAYLSAFKYNPSYGMTFYTHSIAICCGFYCVSQLVWILRNGLKAVHFLLLGGLAGGVGLSSVAVPQVHSFLCTYLGPQLSGWFETTVWWDTLSDVAMLSLLAYFVNRSSRRSAKSSQFTLSVATAEHELLLHA